MGTDISGVIECRRDGGWHAVTELRELYGNRDYDAFGCLFGIQNFARFDPVADDRGWPPDSSPGVPPEEERHDYFGATWITWADVAAVDWDELALEPDSRVHRYQRQPDGTLRYAGKGRYDKAFADHVGMSLVEALANPPARSERSEWEIGDAVYRVVRLRRRDAVGRDWDPVWDAMRGLAAEHRADDVRLVVWFDR